MFRQVALQNLDDYFSGLQERGADIVYFYRICGYSPAIRAFIQKYCDEARSRGAVIEGKLSNPSEDNLSYYEEIMGLSYERSMGFLLTALKRWLPRMGDVQRQSVAGAIYDTLDFMRQNGKNENIQKNAYIKFMCWLYYRFESVVNRLGDDEPPKILYEGQVGRYELYMLSVLSSAGCDVVLLQYAGDRDYRALDPDSRLSRLLELPGLTAFPENFSLRSLREEADKRAQKERLLGAEPDIAPCTNAWMEGKGLDDVLRAPAQRGTEKNRFYNCFVRIWGARDRLSYLNDLYQFGVQIKSAGRRMTVVEHGVPSPTTEEINGVQRRHYRDADEMLMDLSVNIGKRAAACGVDAQYVRLMRAAFIEVMSSEAQNPQMNPNRLTSRAVILLCWLFRYQRELFAGRDLKNVGVFVYLGGCRSANEALFLRLLSLLPVDVLVLVPNLQEGCRLEAANLCEIRFSESLQVDHFPKENEELRVGTAAYHAERELDDLMYRGSGLYRNQQYQRASAVSLQTMYEEISILWNQELKYRPNFSVEGSVVNLPVIFAKISGVKDGDVQAYWGTVRALMTEEVFLVRQAPCIDPRASNPVKPYMTQFLKNGRLQREKIKGHACYRYGFLREEMQEYILDKLQLLIDRRLIRGTFENGTEYLIVATVLNMEKELLRKLQRFDFTKKNPKLIYIHTNEDSVSLEDGILAAFLHLAGADVLFFVPTGYQSVERYFAEPIMEEHQAGEYLYDLEVPDFDRMPANGSARRTWREKIFKRGD